MKKLLCIAILSGLVGCNAGNNSADVRKHLKAQAAALPACATAAAQEFSVPEKLFKAMALAEGGTVSAPSPEARNSYGPMGLGAPAIPLMAKGLGVLEAAVKDDACTNYRAAAWWYANKSVENGQRDDVWATVTRFYYGSASREAAPATERVKKIYAEL
ncbi:hypothetical protein [Pseudomonas sp. EMN2]|uniref:hypothetical protein n=1 Tax=Pseudomonas sp. EMN2 TaxID=2615212 RepID=UPI00129BFCF1|nr:hypothetical protein [Pseudomonas sp. EMN2]